MADDPDETFDFETWLDDPPDDDGEITPQTVVTAAFGGLLGGAALVGDVLDDDDDALLTPAGAGDALDGVGDVVARARGALADLIDVDDEGPVEKESPETENALFSLIDKAGQAIDDLGSRVEEAASDIEGAVRDFGLADADGDKIRNEHEIALGTDPMEMDTDGDGLADGTEYFGGFSDPLKKDTDGDGRSDFREHADRTDPQDPDEYNRDSPVLKQSAAETSPTIHDAFDFLTEGVADAVEFVAEYPNSDPDGDGLTVADEFERGTNPWVGDTDGDKLNDGLEVQVLGTNPLKWDSDADGLSDGMEHVETNSDPLNIDSDGDGESDGLEHVAGTLGQPNDAGDGDSNERGDSFAGRGFQNILKRAAERARSRRLAEESAADDGSVETDEPVLDQAAEVTGGLGTAVFGGPLGGILRRRANADPGQIEQEQPEDVEGGPESSVDHNVTEEVLVTEEVVTEAKMAAMNVDIDVPEPTADDGAIGASDADFIAPAPLQIPDVPELVDVEITPVVVEEPQVDIPEPLQERIEIIDESMDSLTDFDDLTD